MEAAELAEVSRSIRSAMGDSAGQFRQAAKENGANLEKIIKDLSRSFKAQSSQIAELTNSMEETAHETQLTADRIDRLNSSIQESITIQNNMVAGIKNVSLDIRSLITTTSNLDSNLRNVMIGPGAGSLLGGITGKLGTVETALISAIGGIALGAGAKTAYDYVSGGGGGAMTDSSVGKGSAEFQSVTPRLMQDLQRDFPGLTKEDAAAIIGNLGEESGGFGQMKEAGGAGPGRGWAQWTTPDRKAKFLANVQKHGGDLANYDANYETLKQELQGQYAGALKATMAAQGLQNKTQVFMKQFENPGVEHFDVRMKYAQRAMNVAAGAATTETAATTPVSQSPVTPSAPMPQQTTGASSAGGPRVEKIGGEHGHGPISGVSETTPKGLLPAAEQFIGKSESNSQQELQGFISKYHHEIDIKKTPWCAAFVNGVLGSQGLPGTGSDAAKSFLSYGSPVWDRSMGSDMKNVQPGDIAVFNRGGDKGHVGFVKSVSGDNISIIGGNQSDENSGGQVSVSSRNIDQPGGELLAIRRPGAQGPAAPSYVEPKNVPGVSSNAPSFAPSQTSTGTPQAQSLSQQSAVSGGQMAALNASSMVGMMGGMLPGGMGGIVSTLAPMLISAIGSMPPPSLEPMQSQQSTMQNIPEQDPIAELISSLSGSALNAQMVSQAAVQKQAKQEMPSQAIQAHEAKNTPAVSSENIAMNNPSPGYNYNMPWDTGWPDWLDALGGLNYSEMKDIKTSFRT